MRPHAVRGRSHVFPQGTGLPTGQRSRWSTLALIYCLGGLLVGCSQDPEATRLKHVTRGEQDLAQGKLNDAILEFRTALQAAPRSAEGHHLLGRAYQQKGWAWDARREYETAITLRPDLVVAHVDLAAVHLQVGAIAQAETAATEALRLDPTNARGHVLRGMALARRNQLAEALTEIRAGLRQAPELTEGHLGLGHVYRAQGKRPEAEAAYRQALAMDPALAEAQVALGALALGAGRSDEGLRRLQSAVERSPTSILARVSLARLLAAQGKLGEAVGQLEALPVGPVPDPRVAVLSGSLYNRTQQLDKTIALLLPLTKKVPPIADALYLLSGAYLGKGNYPAALGVVDELAQVARSPLILFRRGQILARMGRAKEALTQLTEAGKRDPELPGLHLELASTYLRLGRADEARREAQAARAVTPTDVGPYALLGSMSAAFQDYDQALETLAQGLARDPTSLPLQLTQAEVLEAQGHLEEADRAYRAALDAHPQSLAPRLAWMRALLRRHQWDGAISTGRAALGLTATSAEVYNLMGVAYLGKQEPGAADRAFRTALEADPRYVPAHLNRAVLAWQGKRRDEAERHLRVAADAAPRDLGVTFLLVQALIADGKLPEAVQRLEAAVKQEPGLTILAVGLADLYVQTGHLEQAEATTRSLLASTPTLVPALLLQGLVALQRGRLNQAEAAFRQALTADPKSPEATYQLAQVQRSQNRRTEAIASYKKAQQLDPRQALGRVELAALQAGPEPAKMLAAMERAMWAESKRHPEDPGLRAQLGAVLLARGNLDAADWELRAALHTAPHFASALIGLGRVRLLRQRPDEAEAFLRRALETNPTDLDANLLAAEIAHARGQADQAAAHYRQILAVNPRVIAAHVALAEYSLARGRPLDAEKYARAALHENPDEVRALLVRGAVALEHHQPDAAIGFFQQSLKLNPALARAQASVGDAYVLKGERLLAIRAYRRAVVLAPEEAQFLNDLAWLLAGEQGAPDEALRLAQRAVQLAPKEGRFLDTLGWVYYQQGKYAEAEEHFRAASTLLPAAAIPQYHLGLAAYKQGRREGASMSLKRALLLDPGFDGAEGARKLIGELGG